MRKERLEVEVTIESIGFEGVAVARMDGKVALLKGGLPGERVKALLNKNKKNYAEGFVSEILEKSPDRVDAPCSYFGTCGGCSWQDLDYSQQIYWKRRQLIETLERIGKISPEIVEETMPAERIFQYRNKMDFSFGSLRWLTTAEIGSNDDIDKFFALGLHVPGKYDKIIDIANCHIQPEIGNKILALVRQKARATDVMPYNYNKNEGFLKNLILRFSQLEEKVMAIIITDNVNSDAEKQFIDWFVEELPLLEPSIKVAINAINDRPNTASYGKIRSSTPEQEIFESILGVRYRISPFSFFQTNSAQLDKFIGRIIEFANLSGQENVWDLYSGCGSITLPAAKFCRSIVGIELIDSAVADAKSNAKLNNIANVEFYQADLHSKQIPELLNSIAKPDVIIVDPPRIGMNPNLIEHIKAVAPKRIVYVSCNPSTQARDLEMLSNQYRIARVQPVDMFPHTYHIESIAELILK